MTDFCDESAAASIDANPTKPVKATNIVAKNPVQVLILSILELLFLSALSSNRKTIPHSGKPCMNGPFISRSHTRRPQGTICH